MREINIISEIPSVTFLTLKTQKENTPIKISRTSDKDSGKR